MLGEAADDDAVDAMGAHQPRHLRQRCVRGAADDAEAHHLTDGVLAEVDLGASCGGHLTTSFLTPTLRRAGGSAIGGSLR